jgi:pSer/pThr/pTyr-binding forkhead associated (FHA) protein
VNLTATGTMVVVTPNGPATTYTVQPGQHFVIGRDAGAHVVIDDPRVSATHVAIARLGPGWLVGSLDAANPAMLLDDTGRAQPIGPELGLRSGELLVGACLIKLYPPGS